MNKVVVRVDAVIKQRGYLVFDFDNDSDARKFINDVNFEGDVREDITEVDALFETTQHDIIYQAANYMSAEINNITTDTDRNLNSVDVELVKRYYNHDNLDSIIVDLAKRMNDE